MPEFRCKMLNERGDTLFSADVTAHTLDDAIQHAAEVLHTSNLSSPSRRGRPRDGREWPGTRAM